MPRRRNPKAQCDAKQVFASYAAAARSLRRRFRAGTWGIQPRTLDTPVIAYRCPHCGHWHVGHDALVREFGRGRRQPYTRERRDWHAEAEADEAGLPDLHEAS